MVRLGIVGLGHMGSYHASVVLSINSDKAQLTAIADISQASLLRFPDHLFKTTSYQDIIEKVDAVIVAVPTHMHYEIGKFFLENGIHILVEKPLTHSIEQAKHLFALAQENGCALHVGHVERFNGAVQELKKIIDAPYLIESHRIGPFSPRVAHDTVILDLMIHDLDIILSLVPSEVKKLHIMGNKIYSAQCDVGTVHVEFENGVLATILSSRASQIKRRSMAIHQKDAYIELDFSSQDISIHRRTSATAGIGRDNELRYRQESTIERLFVYKDNPLKLEIEHFLSAIIKGKNLTQQDQDIAALAFTLKLEHSLQL